MDENKTAISLIPLSQLDVKDLSDLKLNLTHHPEVIYTYIDQKLLSHLYTLNQFLILICTEKYN